MAEPTAKQQEVLDYLAARPGEWLSQQQLADALGSTLRGVGVRISALLWAGAFGNVERRGFAGDSEFRWVGQGRQ